MAYSGRTVLFAGVAGVGLGFGACVFGPKLLPFNQEEGAPVPAQAEVAQSAEPNAGAAGSERPQLFPNFPPAVIDETVIPQSIFPEIPDAVLAFFKNVTVSGVYGAKLDTDANLAEIVFHAHAQDLDCRKLKEAWEEDQEEILASRSALEAAQIAGHATELFTNGTTVRAISFNKAAFGEHKEQFELFSGQIIELTEGFITEMPEMIDVSLRASCVAGTYGHDL